MNILLVTTLQAAEATGQAAQKGFGNYGMILMMVAVFAVMWLFMIRPQQKQQKELAKFRSSLEKGHKVVTAGGIHGTVKEIKANTIVMQIDKEVSIEVDKSMIMRAPGEAK